MEIVRAPAPLPSPATIAVQDLLGRPLHDLRVSVMDRCNFRCGYCMPAATYDEGHRFLPPGQRLDFDEIERVCRAAARLGVRKLRLTGGEPLLRPDLAGLVRRLRAIAGIQDIAMTTNGVLLPRHAQALRDAGLDRVTISLDSLDPDQFRQLSGGRGEVGQVLEGLEAARAARFPAGIKLNCVVQRGANEDAVLPLVERFRGSGVALRFIEYMDVGNRNHWDRSAVVPAAEILAAIQARWPLQALRPHYPGEVASRYRFVDGQGEIGMIASITQPFCGDCSRARLSSEGRFHTCLFASAGTDLRTLLRQGIGEAELAGLLAALWRGRDDRYSEQRGLLPAGHPRRRIEMYYIGG